MERKMSSENHPIKTATIDTHVNEPEQINRRGFLSFAIASIGGLISMAMGFPAIAYILGPAIAKKESQAWVRLGSINKVELDTPTFFKVNVKRQTGWLVEEEKIGVFVFTKNGRDFIAMSNICTHLGCRVRWIADQEVFLSPCHNGVFDKEGNVVSGPPPRSLDRYDVKIENGQILIGQLHQIASGKV
jgi:menaquinol-cytochrome c reductase iron-sulfur subunit